MLGTTLIHAPILRENPVVEMALFYDDDCFPTLDFHFLQTLDFNVMLTDAPYSWSEGEPLLFDETEGAAVFKINSAAIDWILAHVGGADESQRADLEMLRVFVAQHGTAAIYEMATF